jgi:hypothetical protein
VRLQATVSRVLRPAGCLASAIWALRSRFSGTSVNTPGELLHIDIKKLGRFYKAGHRVTGDRSERARDIGWDYVLVAVDADSRGPSPRSTPTRRGTARRRSAPDADSP